MGLEQFELPLQCIWWCPGCTCHCKAGTNARLNLVQHLSSSRSFPNTKYNHKYKLKYKFDWSIYVHKSSWSFLSSAAVWSLFASVAFRPLSWENLSKDFDWMQTSQWPACGLDMTSQRLTNDLTYCIAPWSPISKDREIKLNKRNAQRCNEPSRRHLNWGLCSSHQEHWMAPPGGKVPLSGTPWDNREMTSTPAHLTGLCNLVNYLVFSRGVFSSSGFPTTVISHSSLGISTASTPLSGLYNLDLRHCSMLMRWILKFLLFYFKTPLSRYLRNPASCILVLCSFLFPSMHARFQQGMLEVSSGQCFKNPFQGCVCLSLLDPACKVQHTSQIGLVWLYITDICCRKKAGAIFCQRTLWCDRDRLRPTARTWSL